jgi:hypothetical protein
MITKSKPICPSLYLEHTVHYPFKRVVRSRHHVHLLEIKWEQRHSNQAKHLRIRENIQHGLDPGLEHAAGLT